MIRPVYKILYVYILRCADGSYYTGVTNNLDERIQQHNDGIHSESYTFKRRPVVLLYHKIFEDADRAIAFEKQIKGWSRVKKEALIAGDFDKLKSEAVAYRDRIKNGDKL